MKGAKKRGRIDAPALDAAVRALREHVCCNRVVIDPAPGRGLQQCSLGPDADWVTVGPGADIDIDFLTADITRKSVECIISLGPEKRLNPWLEECCRVSQNTAVLLSVGALAAKQRRKFFRAEDPELLLVEGRAWYLFGDWREPGRWTIVD